MIQCYDVSKFFDKEMIEDGVMVCKKRGIDPKAIRLWHKLNDNTKIRVRIPGAGVSETGDVGAVVGQGTIAGALVSQAVLDDGVSDHFTPGGKLQAKYGSVPLAPFMFQDDLLNLTEGIPQAREVNRKVDILMKEKGLSLNEDKSVCVIIGPKQQKLKASEEIEKYPLLCGDFITKEVEAEKWLGQLLSSSGLADSVDKTVVARSGKIKAACREIIQIVNDWRAEVVGGMETALLLWETCCISSMLHGSGSWTAMSVETERKLNGLQRWFIRLVLQVGPGAPLASLLWDFGLLDMELRIWVEKLMLALHVRRLGDETLAKKIYKEQKSNEWPGLVKETNEICIKLFVENVHETKLSSKAYRKKVVEACHKLNEERLRKQAEGKEKCERIAGEKYGKKQYMSSTLIHEVRQMYKTRFGMQRFAGNFSHDRHFARTEWLCGCGTTREEEGHLLSGTCEIYGDMRQKYDTNLNDDDLVKIFNEILTRREKLEEEESIAL